MNRLGELARRLRVLLDRRKFDGDLEEEIGLHLELRRQEHVRSGMAADEARSAARRRFGNATYFKEESRMAWGWAWLEQAAQDLRYAVRMLRKSPGFALAATLTMALGIGATTAIFSVIDGTLLDPLAYREPEQLVSIIDDLPGLGAHDVGLNQPEWQDLAHSGIFDYVSPVWYDENNLTDSSKPAIVRLLCVAPNYFALLGIQPQLGRIFNPEDHRPGFTLEVLISDGLWKRVFGKDPHILDRSIRLDTDLYRIIGVMPPGFRAPGRSAKESNIEVWAATNFYGPPMVYHPPRNRRNIPGAIARLRPGLTIAAAQSRVDALVASLEREYPADYPAQSAWRVRLVPLKDAVVGDIRRSLVLLFGAVGLVLLIGCVNVANLLLARASSRGREMAIRQALGGAQPRLVRQLLTESVFLSSIGGTSGLAILFCAKGFLVRLLPVELPRASEITIDWRVLVFGLLASLVAGAIFGLAPAWHAGRLSVMDMLKREGRGSTGSGQQARTRRVLVVTEFALSLVLMIAATLLLHSFWDLLNARLGFNPRNVMFVRVRLPYPNDTSIDKYATASREAPFLRELLRRSRTLPGVEQAAVGDSGSIPLDQSQKDLSVIADGRYFFTIDGRAVQDDQPSVTERSSVTPEYFPLLGIPLLRGRLFNDFDTDKTPFVAVINEAFAHTFWPHEDPLGQRFKETRAGSAWTTVVGIIADARTESLAEAHVPQLYLDLYQTHGKHLAIFLRGRLDTAAIPGELRGEVEGIDPSLPVFGTQTLDQTLDASLAERRFSMEMIALFALAALLLASLGIYGVISYLVSERTHEIGIRMALGAQRGNILRMVLDHGLRLAIVGAAVGLVGAVVVSELMAGMLYGVRPTDPLTFVGVASLLVTVAVLASYIPARRAVRIDPIVALRDE
ncbi:MAG TPA: ABC transporter permease [Candidatus Cybelea sp.]|nr:ABC transporter permease [Candidatus Cybelea sp.]